MAEGLRLGRTWAGEAHGFSYEVANWGAGSEYMPEGTWNYYVFIRNEQLRSEDFERVWLPVEHIHKRSSGALMPAYDEYNSILNAGDFHGGITFYEKKQCPDTGARWIKVGCDYAHAFDRDLGYPYDETSVRFDAEATCAKLAELLHPLTRCSYTGQYVDPRFAIEHGGRTYSPAGLGCKSAWDRKDRERKAA